jgi:mono/diheme cytochrome c family protein
MSARLIGLLFAVGAGILPAQNTAEIPAQAERGRVFFGEKHCTNCHQLEGRGTAVAPEMAKFARLSPKAFAIMILATRTEYVVSVSLKRGDKFPAMRVSEDEKTVQVYDLSKELPALRKLERSEIDSIRDNDEWKHPPSTTELSDEQLADVIAYIKWVTYKDRKGVSPSEVR